MAKQVTFYHAGCPVCLDAERSILSLVDRGSYDVKVVHLGQEASQIATAENAGVKSVPALVFDGQVLHINHGADLSALK
ncbi:MAG: thioredoxin [Pirellulaceae bacterium]